MLIVEVSEPGVNVRLTNKHQDKIFCEKDDAGQDVRLVAGAVVRVDAPSFKMQQFMYQGFIEETSLEPTPRPVAAIDSIQAFLQSQLSKSQQEELLVSEAARLGFVLAESPVTDGEETDLTSKRRIKGRAVTTPALPVEPPVSMPASTTEADTDTDTEGQF